MAFESSSTHHGGTERENIHMRSCWGTWTYSGMWSWRRGGLRFHTEDTQWKNAAADSIWGFCTEAKIVDEFKRRKWSGIALDNFTEERKWSDDWRRTGEENFIIIPSSLVLKSLLFPSLFLFISLHPSSDFNYFHSSLPFLRILCIASCSLSVPVPVPVLRGLEVVLEAYTWQCTVSVYAPMLGEQRRRYRGRRGRRSRGGGGRGRSRSQRSGQHCICRDNLRSVE
jgi:hypothetical protein